MAMQEIPAVPFKYTVPTAIASFFYVGFIPIIPGTFGSLASFIVYFPLLLIPGWQFYLVAVIFLVGIGIWSAGRAEHDSKIVDPSFVVIDEVAGQLITLFLVPVTWSNLIIGFLLFRALDIVKPFPARRAERLPGGWGIMMDDVLAGIYGNLLLQLGLWIFHRVWS
jgi:phosphatidylglycerophosphatase A